MADETKGKEVYFDHFAGVEEYSYRQEPREPMIA